jgi:hypothetical protein
MVDDARRPDEEVQEEDPVVAASISALDDFRNWLIREIA